MNPRQQKQLQYKAPAHALHVWLDLLYKAHVLYVGSYTYYVAAMFQ
jgi:hypothetical protein